METPLNKSVHGYIFTETTFVVIRGIPCVSAPYIPFLRCLLAPENGLLVQTVLIVEAKEWVPRIGSLPLIRGAKSRLCWPRITVCTTLTIYNQIFQGLGIADALNIKVFNKLIAGNDLLLRLKLCCQGDNIREVSTTNHRPRTDFNCPA